MKRFSTSLSLMLLVLHLGIASAIAVESDFDALLAHFDYDTRADMKIESKQLLRLLVERARTGNHTSKTLCGILVVKSVRLRLGILLGSKSVQRQR